MWGLKIGYLPENNENKLTIDCILELIRQKMLCQQSREQIRMNLSQAVFERNKYQSMLEQEKMVSLERNKMVGKL